MAQSTFVPSEFATFAGIIWFAALVTIGIRSTAAALVAGLRLRDAPGVCQAYLPTWTANVLPVLFGLGAISAAKYPDGSWPSRADGSDGWSAVTPERRRRPFAEEVRPEWPRPRRSAPSPDGRGRAVMTLRPRPGGRRDPPPTPFRVVGHRRDRPLRRAERPLRRLLEVRPGQHRRAGRAQRRRKSTLFGVLSGLLSPDAGRSAWRART